MTIDKILVLVLGTGLIGLIYWFFFGKKDDAGINGKENQNTLIVDGGYKPSIIYVDKDKPKVLSIIRHDANSCLEEIVFPDYKIKKYLPLHEKVEVTLNIPHKEGDFHCGMNMFFGKVKIIKN